MRDQARILIAESGSGYGGTARYLASLLALLDRTRFGVRVLSYGLGPIIRKIEKDGSIVHYRTSWRYPWWSSRFLGLFQLAVVTPSIFFWLKRRRIALVHLNNEIYSHLPLLMASRLAGARILCHLHGWRRLTRIERLLAGWVDQFVSISEAGAQFFREELDRDVIAISNGLAAGDVPTDLEARREKTRRELGLGENEVLVSSVGRLVPWKGQEVFVKALAKVSRENPAVKGLILGRDESQGEVYLGKLKKLAGDLGLGDRLHFLSWREDVWSLYAATDILVHTSTQPEPFGLVALEAMFAGKPVIATRGGGITDLVKDGETGRLVEPGDAQELAQAILHLVADPSLARKWGEKGRERALGLFDMRRNAEKISEIYESLLHASGRTVILSPQGEGSQRFFASLRMTKGSHAMRNLKKAIKQTLYETGTLRVLRRAVGCKVPILMYHRIAAAPDPFFPALSPEAFRRQMVYVKRNYRVLSMDELIQCWKSDSKIPPKSLVLTIDDGDAETWSFAYPVLEELKMPVTLFLTTGPIDKKGFLWTDLLRLQIKRTRRARCRTRLNGRPHEWSLSTPGDRLRAAREIAARLKMLPNEERKEALHRLEKELGVRTEELENKGLLTWDQVKRMPREQVTFGAHADSHAILSRLPVEEAKREIFTSKGRLEQVLGEKVHHFAYPNGEAEDFTPEHEKLVAEAGFDSACSAILGLNDHRTNRYALRRVYAMEESLAPFATRLVGLGS